MCQEVNSFFFFLFVMRQNYTSSWKNVMGQEDKCIINRIQANSCLVFHGTMFIFDIHYFTFQKKHRRDTFSWEIGARSI